MLMILASGGRFSTSYSKIHNTQSFVSCQLLGLCFGDLLSSSGGKNDQMQGGIPHPTRPPWARGCLKDLLCIMSFRSRCAFTFAVIRKYYYICSGF